MPVKILALPTVMLLILVGCQQVDYEKMYKPVLDQYAGFWNTGNLEGVENVLHPEFQLFQVPDFKPQKGIDAFREEMKRMREINFWVRLDEFNYGKDVVSLRWTCGGSFPDSTGATNTKVESRGLSLIHLKDGKILDEWISYDIKSWMEQLGYKMVK